MFCEALINGWQNGTIARPTAFELFDGLKVRIKEVNPSGMIIVTILPSTRAQLHLLGQRSIEIDISHIMSLMMRRMIGTPESIKCTHHNITECCLHT